MAAHDLESLTGRIRLSESGGTWLLTYSASAFAGLQVVLTAMLTGFGTTIVRAAIKLIGSAPANPRNVPRIAICTVTRSNARARRLYGEAGFITFGIEHRAIKVGETYYDKEHMVLFLQ